MNTGTTDDHSAGTSETLSSTVPIATTADPSDSSAPSTSTSTSSAPVPSLEGGPPNVVATEVMTATSPIGLATRHGDERLFIIEQDGLILALDLATGLPDRVADLSEWTSAWGEQGLLGLAFSSDGDLAYVNYTDRNGDTVIAEYGLDDEGRFDPTTRRVVLEIDQPYRNHNGGRLVTGPDSMLYIGMGDGGSRDDPQRRATDLSSLHGAVLRIDPTPLGDRTYQIPTDNPFRDVAGARPELFAIGLRNPWGFGFDPATSDLWVVDVGQNAYEEPNIVPASEDVSVAGAGVHFGWSAFEGFEPFNNDVVVTDHHRPVMVYEHGQAGCSIIGGMPYRSDAIPSLSGAYIFGDYCSGNVWAFDPTTGTKVLLTRLGQITGIGAGPDGEIYVTSTNGAVSRIDPA
jgi:glucose/arabinose dehydrogenase